MPSMFKRLKTIDDILSAAERRLQQEMVTMERYGDPNLKTVASRVSETRYGVMAALEDLRRARAVEKTLERRH